MTSLRKFLGLLLISGLFSLSANAVGIVRPMGDGMPLPWPFPWAKECPVNWESMQGRYLLMPNAFKQQLDLKISVIASLNFKLVRVSRYGQDGLVIADGYTWISANQKTVRLWLFPLRAGDPPTWAVLKLHHADDNVLDCAQERLVPILSLEQIDNTVHMQSRYRLVRVGI